MRNYILSIQGNNRTGIVADVTRLLYEHHINITDSAMTTLRSEFTMMMIVELPDVENIRDFEMGFKALESKDLSVFLKPLSEAESRHSDAKSVPTHTLSVLGRDRTGIIYHFSDLLASHGINITDVNTRLMDDDEPRLYAMILELFLPEDIDITHIQAEIRAVAEKLGVDANLHPIEYAEI